MLFTPAIPALFVLLYALSQLAHIHQFFDANSDIASSQLLSLEFIRHHWGNSFTSWVPYTTVAGNVLTYALPNYRWWWHVWPYLSYLVVVAALGVTLTRRVDRWTAVVVTSLLVALPAEMFAILTAQFAHGPTYVTVVCVPVAFYAINSAKTSRSRAAMAVIAGAIIGANWASDPYVVVVVILPLVLVTAYAFWAERNGDRSTPIALAWTLAVASFVCFVVRALGRHVLLLPVAGGVPIHRVSIRAMAQRAPTFAKLSIQTIIGDAYSPHHRPVAITVVLGAIAVVILFRALTPLFQRLPGGTELPVRLMAVFVATNIVAVLAANVVNLDALPGESSLRYLVSIPICCAVIVPLRAKSARARISVSIAVAVLSIAAGFGFVSTSNRISTDLAAYNTLRDDLTKVLTARGVTYGYGPYWDATSVTWRAHERIKMRPVLTCGTNLCPTFFQRNVDWYRSKMQRPTFLVIDKRGTFATFMDPTPPASLGQASEVLHRHGLDIYIYDYDIATRFRNT